MRRSDRQHTKMTSGPPSGPVEKVVEMIYQLRTEEAEEPLQTLRELLEPCRDSSNPSALQSTALEVLNNSFVMQVVFDKHWDDVLHTFLAFGLQIRQSDMSLAIHRARERQSFRALQYLFESVWDINRPLNSHCPPAIRSSLLLDHRDFVETCLSMGAKLNISSLSGHTIMQRAVVYAPLSTIKVLVHHGAIITDTNLLPHAALAYIDTAGEPGMPDRLEVIVYLLDHGASVNAFYNDTLNSDFLSGEHVFFGKMNALHLAIVGGKRDLVELLLKHGADPTLDTWCEWKTQGKTISSVALAQMCGFEDIASMLTVRSVIHS